MPTRGLTRETQIRIASALNVAIGFWLIYSGFSVPAIPLAVDWNHGVLGMLLALTAAFRLGRPDRYRTFAHLHVLLGIWLGASTFLWGYLGMREVAARDLILGVAVAVLGAWSAAGGGARGAAPEVP
jgi:hypothetical protein